MERHAIACDVAIVGGGLAGLSCAIGLQGSGLDIRIFEQSDRLGGRACSWQDALTGDEIDLGPHILVSEYRNMLALMKILGTQDAVVWQDERLIRLVESQRCTDIHVHPLPPPLHLLPSMMKVRSITWRDKLSNLPMLNLAMRMDERLVAALDEVSALELLRSKGVSQRFIDWFWASACIAVMNVPLQSCSAGALMRIMSRLFGRKRYRIGFPDGGLASLFATSARKLIEKAGGKINFQTRVRSIECESSGATGLRLIDGTTVKARHVLIATPPRELLSMLPRPARGTPAFAGLDAFEPSPYISIYLWFDRKVATERFWSRVWDPLALNTDFYDLSNIRTGWRERPSVLASNIIFSHRAADLSDRQIIETTRAEAARAEPSIASARLIHAVVNRIPMAITCPAPGMERKRLGTHTDIPGLLLAGDWTRTGLPSCMESAVHSGFAAAETIWQSIGRPRSLVLPMLPTEGLSRLVYLLAARGPSGRRL